MYVFINITKENTGERMGLLFNKAGGSHNKNPDG